MDTFWPGPLTLILNANQKNLPTHLKHRDGTLAVRYTSSPVVQSLIETGDCPIVGTSANLSGMKECFSASEVLKQFKNKIDLIINDEIFIENQASTILNCTRKDFKILREGAINLSDLLQVCDKIS